MFSWLQGVQNWEQSGAETTQISCFEVATTVFVVTFSLNCARNGSLSLGSSEWIRRQGMMTLLSLLSGSG